MRALRKSLWFDFRQSIRLFTLPVVMLAAAYRLALAQLSHEVTERSR